MASVAGVIGDTTTWYIGSASGGVWKSTDGGHRFMPVFDSMAVQAIGALAVAPSNPNVVWAGTGEAWAVRDADIIGDGVYKSDDGGKTWKNMGLRETGRIARIIVNPGTPDIVYVCALGRLTAPQQERGVYKTTDGGKTWRRVLFVDENTGCSSLAMDAKNADVLYAGAWQVAMHPWAELSGGTGSGIYKSTDAGEHWTRIEDPGLPKAPVGKVAVAVAPTNPNRVYALMQTATQGSLWRSDDAGAHWTVVSHARDLIGRGGYYIHLVVSSGNADEVIVSSSSVWLSQDGGKTFRTVPWGGDNHDIWMDPRDPDHFAITNDAGARLTMTHGRTWNNVAIANGQVYHVALDHQIPYWVYGNRQDDGTFRGPSSGAEQGAAA
ncbi:MAG TPA: glycosyl hydrolase, partial [Gemmatimonadaceae bacterium]|nr:glycosyl hydrolase [Gemmatimonadaceae bacterium]